MFQRHTHSQQLEAWLGKEEVEHISSQMRHWYGAPIPIRGVPGAVFAARGGDFVGPIAAGRGTHILDFIRDRWHLAQRQWAEEQRYKYNAGFSSLGDMIAKATAGKKRHFVYTKNGTTGAVSATNSLWRVGAQPGAASAASAAPGGDAPTSATTGAIPYADPTGGETLHLSKWEGIGTVSGNTLLLYDRIFQVAKTMNSTGTEAVTGVGTRYQGTTAGAVGSAENNFLIIECGQSLPSTNHNWTVCTYTDQAGNTGATLPSVTGINTCPANRLDQPVGTWFCPLATGDTGILALTQMQCSALVATGTIDFVIGHPLAMMPCQVANFSSALSLINDAFSVERIHDGACLAFLELFKSATTATTYAGMIEAVHG